MHRGLQPAPQSCRNLLSGGIELSMTRHHLVDTIMAAVYVGSYPAYGWIRQEMPALACFFDELLVIDIVP
ncbi:hypothetical protein GCM10008985_33010 [Halococcus dombrowskii]|uniref:Uncharacterized protein n=2 Tax=Halococcus dombrowskii TaxID=179637 RepID=A0AAV3SJZ0_HALDO